jgi:hypothetical protein
LRMTVRGAIFLMVGGLGIDAVAAGVEFMLVVVVVWSMGVGKLISLAGAVR